MTEKPGGTATKKTWQLVELHGCWWAYEGESLPPPEAFQSHGRPPQPPILGPYPSRVIADAMLRQPRRGGPADPQKGFRLPPMGR
jgi:hypothetical protein